MATTHSEREAKFEGAGRFDPRDLRRLPAVDRVREEQPEELDAIYYDTADLRLLAHGVTLRRRRGGHDSGWHVKLPAGPADGTDRVEVHAPLRAGKPGAVPDELLSRTAVYARGRKLRPVAHLRTHRRRHTLLDRRANPLAEVARDAVAAQSLDPRGGGAAGTEGTRTRITQWSEIEVELVDGGPELLRAAAKRLDAAGWHRSPSHHKLDHALADELDALRGPGAGPAKPPRAGSAGEAVVNRLREQFAELLRTDPGTRADAPEALHDLRSAARRLRNLLRAQRRVLDRSRTDPVARELRWLTGRLADARDHEVLAERLPRRAVRLRREDPDPAVRSALRGLPGRIRDQERARHDEAFRGVAAALGSPRYFALLDALEALLADPPLRRRARKPAVGQLRKAAEHDRRRLTQRVAAAGRAAEGPERERALHGVRKAARRARHTAETALPYGGKPAERLRKRTRKLQKLLGEYQDAVVAGRALVSLSEEAAPTNADPFGYGLLHAAQAEDRHAAERHLPRTAARACAKRLTRLT